MSLLSNFITNHALSLLEAELLKHEPEAQALLLNEVQVLVEKASEWVNAKLANASK